MGALLELRSQLRKLQWYGEVNRRGFIKITKKLDKKVANASTQRRYLESKVDPRQFATNLALSHTMKTVNDWLSALGDLKIPDDDSSTHSTHSLKRTSSRTNFNLSSAFVEKVDRALRNDDSLALGALLRAVHGEVPDEEDASQSMLSLNLLQRAVSCRAKACIDDILGRIQDLNEDDDINHRNCIHRLVISMGRSKTTTDEELAGAVLKDMQLGNASYITPATAPSLAPQASYTREADGVTELGREDRSVVLLQYLLDKLRPHQRDALRARDNYGRMPLHYAAQYGFVIVCQLIIARMQSWGQFEVEEGIDAPFWQDADGYAPLHLSVIGGHPHTTEVLLGAENWQGVRDRKGAIHKHKARSSEVLALATKSNFVVIVRLLVAAGVDLDYQDDQGESALHVAARFGHLDCARALVDRSKTQKANLELTENSFGWTPLFIASVDGHLSITELLIEAGADLERLDTSGWTAKEHAALRGHIAIANALADVTTAPSGSDSDSSASTSLSATPATSSLAERKSNGTSNGNGTVRTTEPIKTFGHRYLTKESMVLVSLGTMDTRKAIEAVNLDRIPIADAHSTQLDTALSLVLSATGAKGEPSITDLPVQDNISTEPIVFTTIDATKVKLIFDIVPTYAGNNEQIVGRGVALLSSIKPSVGSKRITLQGDVTVPIIAAGTLEVIGSVNFNFLIITPFTHPNMTITENQTYWKSMTSTMVIGHRGDLRCLLSIWLYLIVSKVWARTWPLGGRCNLGRILYR
jgi:glycerophosphodiester phosphodiesterase